MGKIKDSIYNFLVRKNKNVQYEYERYVMEHTIEHHENRFKHWKMLFKLNWHYRVKQSVNPMLYWDKRKEILEIQDNMQRLPLNEEKVNRSENLSTKNDSKDTPSKNDSIKIQVLSQNNEVAKDKRIPVMSFVMQLLKYDVISFDIFDTLVFRPFSNPRDLFFVVGRKLDILDFRRIRIDAENYVRKEAMLKYNNHEIGLREIYEYIERRTGLDANYGMKVEIETEKELIYANPYMLRVCRLLKSQKKKMIATSDMYLPSDVLCEILLNCGYDCFEEIHVSCEYRCNKRNGGLYKSIFKKYSSDIKIVHIGDNWESDIVSAKENGIDTKFYKNVNAIGEIHRAKGMSDLIGSAYSGIVNAWLYSGFQDYSPYYQYGFIYGGIYILGYCNWIHKKVKKENIDKIIFLSRDGEIYQRIYKFLYPNENNTEFLYWSRIANVKTTINEMRANFLSSTIKNKAVDEMNITARALLSTLNLSKLEKYLKNYCLKPETVIIRENYMVLEDLLIDHWDEVIELYQPYEDATKQVLINKIGDAKKVAVIDVGWTGTGPLGIKKLIEKKWNLDIKVFCYVAASRVWGHVSNISQITEETVESYIFSRQYNRGLYDTHVRTNNNTNNIYFEFFTQAKYPSFGGYYLKNGNIVCEFDVPEVENYEKIELIHKGIEDFCKEYVLRFKNEDWMFNISGYDAYVPYRHAILNMKFIKDNFGNFKFARGIASDESEQKLESMQEIWRKSKMI